MSLSNTAFTASNHLRELSLCLLHHEINSFVKISENIYSNRISLALPVTLERPWSQGWASSGRLAPKMQMPFFWRRAINQLCQAIFYSIQRSQPRNEFLWEGYKFSDHSEPHSTFGFRHHLVRSLGRPRIWKDEPGGRKTDSIGSTGFNNFAKEVDRKVFWRIS